ncbi:D-inositol-3-phosphate glycosyltransferase [Bradyrhizobium ivorense]|uniref:D-inositol-3-phosphate glycosyltransferase n=1 Tax=Bradyrhizobium ivorense TaxID=2511166 RepID=A0A508TQR0_9BRAD|nr:glycosyltransferase family 4 protein [Bradyrhizobium ivorense]VIO76760.1 D-inositol-3-phosphate glycosyltransferase [Bradyrhizobium ivorense]
MPSEFEKPRRRETFNRVVLATQYYPPDPTSTATYIGKIAEAFAVDTEVVVLSATKQSASPPDGPRTNPFVIEQIIPRAKKTAVVSRALSVLALSISMFFGVLKHARKNDLVFCVTNPFTLPYAVVLAAKLRGAATELLIYDVYPEALVAAGFIGSGSPLNKMLRLLNGIMFRALDSIVVVGRDVPPLLTKYRGVKAEKLHFIPNWTFLPIGYRDLAPSNRYRPRDAHLVVGLSGNLGFTHDPATVFAAARILRNEAGIHFLLSGWGMGWKQLNALQSAEQLPNVTLIEPVPAEHLVEFLSAADVWAIPYRRNMAGVSIPSRLYNLLAIGRAVIACSEDHSEAAIEVAGENIGWVVPPEDPDRLAEAIRAAAANPDQVVQMGRSATVAAEKFTEDAALARYRDIVAEIRAGR